MLFVAEGSGRAAQTFSRFCENAKFARLARFLMIARPPY
jgi:hypothetical protein